MIALGHRDSDLWSYSPEKFFYMARLARQRRAREAARMDLRQLQITRTAYAANLNPKNERRYRVLERQLLEAAELAPTKPDPRAAVRGIIRRISGR